MGQLALFAAGETLLVDDERGRIVYTPAFIDADTARVWFDEIRARVRWRAERRIMYDREVGVPRLVSHFWLDPPGESVPQAILDAARRVIEQVGEPFNSVGLNLYRNGRDSVAPHNDHLNGDSTGLFDCARIAWRGATYVYPREGGAAPRHAHRPRAGQPVGHELRHAVALYACRAEDHE